MKPVILQPKFLPFDDDSLHGRLMKEVLLISEKFLRDGLN
jgi:hypothetical protein